MSSVDLDNIRHSLKGSIGSKIRIVTKKGKNKTIVKRGVLEGAYPSIFVVKLDNTEESVVDRRVSYSYTDILTKAVEIAIFVAKKPAEEAV